jgi:N-acetylglucosaminyldiphosphoundecaprenol N-acetyl-beta-D-mannosaminyltransferase
MMNDLPARDRCEPTAAPAARPSSIDYDRPVVAVLGLPFDAIGLEAAAQRVRSDAFAGRRCFVSTPNLNFAIAARRDAAFRASVLHSDLSLADGMPLVWIARLLGLPVTERVSGADLFERLRKMPGEPLRVYLFGGPDGVAERAAARINAAGGGLRCVGYETPGFGSVESMSSAAQIDRINASGAHFVVVALGAAKGQAWIERNAARLAAPVLSHLGAVINFSAGAVSRAPPWMQRSGLEWAWRVYAEPGLWRRYADDGLAALGLLATRVLPDWLDGLARAPAAGASAPRAAVGIHADGVTLLLSGDFSGAAPDALRSALARIDAVPAPVRVDLAGATAFGAAAVGLLLLASGRRHGLVVVGATAVVVASLRRKLADGLLAPASANPAAADDDSATPDWGRETKSFWHWNPARSLLATLRTYERVRHSRRPDHRLQHWLTVLRHRFWSVVTGAEIQLGTRIGGGLMLPHPNGIVVHPSARIGANCLLFQQVTLGTGGPVPGAPVLEDGAEIGAGAKVLGGVVIGARAVVGANAVVLCDVPAGATAVGIPARVIPDRDGRRSGKPVEAP